MTVRPPNDSVPLPRLVTKSRLALEQEARALKGALDDYATMTPAAGCPYQADLLSAKRAPGKVRNLQRQLLAAGQQQARLILVSGYDHLVSMARLLDGAMPLYAHVTMSRSVAEAAVRHEWLLDPAISYEERITRSAAMLSNSVANRLKGARQSLGHIDSRIGQPIIADRETEVGQVHDRIRGAGLNVVYDKNGRDVASIRHPTANVKAAVKLETGPRMEKLLPESPGWHLQSSGIAHSVPWLLDSAVIDGLAGPELSLTTDLMEVAAAAETAISASALIIRTHATYYGFDPEPCVRQSSQRRGMLDALMGEQAARQQTNPDPLIPAG